MLEVEVQKLTAAIEALVAVLSRSSPLSAAQTIPTISDNYRQDDSERLAKLDKIEKEQAEHAKTMDEVYGKTLAEKKRAEDIARRKEVEDAANYVEDLAMAAAYKRHDATMVAVYGEAEVAKRKQAEDDAMAAIYKREAEKKQTVKARKAHAVVTTEETKALVDAAIAPEKAVEKPAVTDQPLKDKEENPKSPEAEKIAVNIGEGDLKALAMEIARADSSARPIILGILGEHGAKTITQLDAKHYHAVHGKFLSLAHDIAKDGVPF